MKVTVLPSIFSGVSANSVGLASLAVIILILDYMRTRFGLKPEEYQKEDIEFVEKEAELKWKNIFTKENTNGSI